MADTLEYSGVAFPLSRFDEALVRELERHAPSMVEYQRAKTAARKSWCATCTSSAA